MQCSAVLAPAAGANWLVFDGTKTGAILGALLAVGAPLGEVFIVNVLGLWHYDRPDFFGVPHWAGKLRFLTDNPLVDRGEVLFCTWSYYLDT